MTDTINLEPVIRGDDAFYTVTITDDEGAAQDITGDVFFIHFKYDIETPDNEAELSRVFTAPSGQSSTDGTFTIAFTDEETDLEPGTLHYDVRWRRESSANSEIVTLVQGIMNIVQRVTINTDLPV